MKAEAFTYDPEQGKDAQAGRRAMSGCRAMSRGQPSCSTGISASPSRLQSWSTPRTSRRFGGHAPVPTPTSLLPSRHAFGQSTMASQTCVAVRWTAVCMQECCHPEDAAVIPSRGRPAPILGSLDFCCMYRQRCIHHASPALMKTFRQRTVSGSTIVFLGDPSLPAKQQCCS